MDINRRLLTHILHSLKRGKRHRDTCLVVQMARNDKAIVDEFGLRIYGNDITHLNAQPLEILEIASQSIDTQLHMVPADRGSINFLIKGMTRSLEWQDGSAICPLFGKDGCTRSFSKARGPVANRHKRQSTILLESLDLCPQRVQMRNDGARPFAP